MFAVAKFGAYPPITDLHPAKTLIGYPLSTANQIDNWDWAFTNYGFSDVRAFPVGGITAELQEGFGAVYRESI